VVGVAINPACSVKLVEQFKRAFRKPDFATSEAGGSMS